MTEQIFTAITEIITAKRAAKQVPAIALYRELSQRFDMVTLRAGLRVLTEAKRVRFGHTANDWYFEII